MIKVFLETSSQKHYELVDRLLTEKGKMKNIEEGVWLRDDEDENALAQVGHQVCELMHYRKFVDKLIEFRWIVDDEESDLIESFEELRKKGLARFYD